MQIKILYFAAIRERLGISTETLSWEPSESSVTVKDVKTRLEAAHPILKRFWPSLRISLNLEFAEDDMRVRSGDELALIPPVAGGHDGVIDPLDPKVWLSAEPIDPRVIEARVTHPGAGALVTFTGVVRNRAQGKAVQTLEYEVYPEMAAKKLRQVANGVELEFPSVLCAVCHRYGVLAVGDIAIVIAVSAPHRKLAFEACEAAIDRIKAEVPIWKRETGPDGVEWVGMGS
jgi:molybdopterin synthase catalytic subunit/molybdopterin converting factor small subunit